MQKLRVGVLMGGKSLEKEVSFNSGRTICDHLDTTRYSVIPLFQTDSKIYVLPWHFLHRGKTTDFEHRLAGQAEYVAWDDLKKYIDFIYIAQHGRYAEDGTLQGFLEILDIPYVGSGVFASALRMDKIAQKTFLHNAGITTPRYIAVEPHQIDNFEQYKNNILQKLINAHISNNYVVKPSNEGSSIGISIINSIDDLESALKKACYVERGKKKRVLIEEKITGMEFTCITLHNGITGEYISLPPTEIIPELGTTFFDYEQKYMPGRGVKRTPASCSSETTKQIQQTCIAVMRALEFTTMSRIDGFVTHDNHIVIIDPNTLSGMAPSSFIFNQAAERNMSPSHIINHIIETELQQYNMLDAIVTQEKMEQTTMHTEKIRVAVLLGGASNEKETSLDSGRNVFYKLSPHKYDAIAVFVGSTLELYTLTQSQLVRNSTREIIELLQESQKIKWNDLPTIADFIFNALHGGEGENGSVQGTLEMLGIPYNGSSVLTSALCINKYKTNQLLASHGFDVPLNMYVTKEQWNSSFDTPLQGTQDERRENIQNKERNNQISPPSVISDEHSFLPLALSARRSFLTKESVSKGNLTYPLIVKPHDDGCSVMVQKVHNETELHSAIEKIVEHKDAVLIEECIIGMELTVGVIGNDHPRALPPSQAISAQGILSIQEKFLPGAGENQTPALLSQEALRFVQDVMEKVYTILQCKGYARIDCFYQNAQISPTGKERVVILEVNTLPGLTPATCLFHQVAEIGLRPMDFIDTLIMLGFEEHNPKNITHEKLILCEKLQ